MSKTSLKLHAVKNPLRVASKRKAVDTVVVLVDADLKARTVGAALPTLPPGFRGQTGERADVQTKAGRVIAIGCGRLADEDSEPLFWESAGAAVVDVLRAMKVAKAALGGALLPKAASASVAAQRFALGAALSAYRCVAYRKHLPKDHFEVEALALQPADWKASERGRELADAINWTRAMVDAPANLLHPQSMAAEAKSLKSLGVDVEVIDMAALERMGAGGLLAVGQSSVFPPCLVVLRWQGRKAQKTVDLGLVGKGLTFDGGGLNLKPRPGIEKMKFDMGGAAAVLGTLRVLAQRRAPVNVVATIALCENIIDAKSFRPGDVITSLSGLTIEVDNTDAEGRIVLADALTHTIDQFKPRLLVDVATLTGSVMAALHEEFAGLFSKDDALARALEQAAVRSTEALWRMPLVKQQDYLVDSEIADVKNVGAPGMFGAGMGSAIAGAKFLERFVGDTRWAHLDIAGTAWSTRPRPGIPRGATGYGVRLLDALVDALP